jgi:hypothetical protein
MWQAISAVVAAVVAPLLGGAARASRRRRLADRARALHKLADDIEAHDKAGADKLRDIGAQIVQRVVELERQSLQRRFDPTAPFVYLLFVLPAALGAFFAWKYSGWWTWPVFVICGLWTAIVTSVAWQNVWQEHEAAEQAEEAK